MFDFKILTVERTTDCPLCGEILLKGEIMYKDKDRGETLCSYCIDNYKEEVIRNEGEDGRLLK